MDENEANSKIAKSVTIAVICVFAIFITGISSCTMFVGSMEVENINAKTEYLKVETDQQEKQNSSIQLLIVQGVSPVAARCAIIGWETERDAIICTAAGVENPNIMIDNLRAPN